MSDSQKNTYAVIANLFLTICIALVLSSCATNPVLTYYQGIPDARTDPRTATAYDKNHNGPLIIYPTADQKNEVRAAIKRGFSMIGQSDFTGPSNTPLQEGIKKQAALNGAHLALYSVNYKDTISGVAPIVIPQTSTTVTNANVSAFGSGGFANAYGTGRSTTYSSQVVPMSYTIDRSDFHVAFLMKPKRARLGIHPIPLTDSEINILQSNNGIKVDIVIDGSSASQADILPSDIILAMSGEKVFMSNFWQLLDKYEGQSVKLDIYRNGKRLVKNVEIKPNL